MRKNKPDQPSLMASSTPSVILNRGWDIQQLPKIEVELDEIKDVFACSPLQEGILMSSSSYAVYWVWKCVSYNGEKIDTNRLEAAWKTAASQHEIFSTVFGPHPDGKNFCQIVLNTSDVPVSQVTASFCPEETLCKLERPGFTAHKPKHLFTICQSSTGEVACRLDICHTLCDAYSLSILLRDVVDVYHGRLQSTPPPFREVVRYIENRKDAEILNLWTDFLSGTKGCKFPIQYPLSECVQQVDIHHTIALSADSLADITGFCKRAGITRSVFVHIAWALVLSHYSGMDDVCFGYMSSGRDIPVEGSNRIFGPLANMLISRINLQASLCSLIGSTKDMLKAQRNHQQISLAEIQHALGVSGGLFNTMVSLLRTNPFGEGDGQTFAFEQYHMVSPHEFDLLLEGYLNPDSLDLKLYYNKYSISHEVAQEVCTLLSSVTQYLTSSETALQPESLSDSFNNERNVVAQERPKSLYDDFFVSTFGTSKSSTVEFWKAQLSSIQKNSLLVSTSPASVGILKDVHLMLGAIKWNRDFLPEIVIRAAWSILLARLGESDETLFGVNMDRQQVVVPGGKSVTTHITSKMPVRAVLDFNSSVSHFLQSLQSQAEDIALHEGPGLHWIRQIGTDAAAASELYSLLVFRSAKEQIEGATMIEKELSGQTLGNHSLVTECQITDQGLRLCITFASEIFSQSRIQRIISQFGEIIRQLSRSESDTVKLQDLDIMTNRDLEDVWIWNSDVCEAENVPVQELFRFKVLEHPKALAIEAWDGTWTYGQLDEQSTRLAHRLLDQGIGPGSTVPLCFEKSIWMSVAMLGVMKTGAAAVGLDPKQPEERLRTVVDQTKARLILSSITKRDLAHRIGRCKVLSIGTEFLNTPFSEEQSRLPVVDPQNVLYIVFTSGSTGTPKGVQITHKSYSSAVTCQHEAFGFNSNSRVLDFSSYAFDAAWFNLLHTITSGATLCVPSDEQLQNTLFECFEMYRITLTFLTPSIARHIDHQALARLDSLLLGGEEVLPKDVVSLAGTNCQVKIMYGPSECTPMTTCHNIDASGRISIGRGVGVCTWIVDPANFQSLTPVGMVGELCLEGPLVGNGYLNDPERTAASFVEDPIWLLQGGPGHRHRGRHGRLYRTGDLVRYNEDGTIVYVRRKDTQVKIRGQRVELGEVEEHVQKALLATNSERKPLQVYAETIQPVDMETVVLVVFLKMNISKDQTDEEHACSVRIACKGLGDILAQKLPVYMVPAAFIPVPSIPMTITGKIDRIALRKIGIASWLDYRAASEENEAVAASTEMEKILQEVWVSVLKLPTKAVSIDKAFTKLGGDSITAMQVVSKCRAQQISVSMSDVLQAGTIQKLAPRCTKLITTGRSASSASQDLDTSVPFLLSPIQMKYLNLFPNGLNHFNQSFLLEMTQDLPATVLYNALRAVVNRHGMLRARFHQDRSGVWTQFVAEVNDHNHQFAFDEHNVTRRSDVLEIAQARQGTLDISVGPVFAGDHFNIENEKQMLVLSAHHLVVDLVSWRIIWSDIEEHVKFGQLGSQSSPSFSAWCHGQSDMARKLRPDEVLPFQVPKADFEFWDFDPTENTRTNSEDRSFSLDSDITGLLMGQSNDALRTEPLDIILGVFGYSFRQAFPERSVPALFLEGHGREQSDNLLLDVSGTVGWFTTVHPLPLNLTSESTIIHAVRSAKDMRRQVPSKGQPYFASRFYSEECKEEFQDHDNIELLVNFAGRYQQLESTDGLFNLAKSFENNRSLEVVSQTSTRLALIEANMAIQDGKFAVTFTFHKGLKHQERLRRWFDSFIPTLETAVDSLINAPVGLTRSDVPLMKLSDRGLDVFLNQHLPSLGINASDVADLYPALPMQEGMLLSANAGLSSYATFWIWTCVPTKIGGHIIPSRLESAWRMVAHRHAILSTIFGTHPESTGFVQIVLSGPKVNTSHITIPSGSPTEALYSLDSPKFPPSAPHHMFTICQSGEDIACRLDINHTMLDGASLSILVQDIVSAYDNVPLHLVAQFKESVRHITEKSREETVSFWTSFLEGVQACEVPRSYSPPKVTTKDTFRYIAIPSTSISRIFDFCRSREITRPIFLQVCWAMVLFYLTGMQDVCFGYLASGRNIPVDGIEKIAGPLANMLISRVNLQMSPAEVLRRTSYNSIEHLSFQHVSLAEVQHRIGIRGRPLFNTALTVREADRFTTRDKRSMEMQYQDHQDPHEYDLLLSGQLDGERMKVAIQIRESSVSQSLAEEVALVFVHAIEFLLSTENKSPRETPTVKENGEKEKEPLCQAFFYHLIGNSEDSTMAFWKGQFANFDTEYFPPLKGQTKQSQNEHNFCFRVKGLNTANDNFTAMTKIWSAWSMVAARNASSVEALFGGNIPGYPHPQLPIRVILDWTSSGNALLQSVEQKVAEITPFARTGLSVIRRASHEAGLSCSFQATITAENESSARSFSIINQQELRKHGVEIRYTTNSKEAFINIGVGLESISEEGARRLGHHFEYAVRQLSNPDIRGMALRDIMPISPQELETIWAWNTPLPEPVQICMHDLIELKALSNPEAPAICAWDGNLTYEQLNNLATVLAYHISNKGVGPGKFVPLLFEKSMWMPVAMLAVMKAGAAGVAMDITQPKERLRSIMGQINHQVVLASATNSDLALHLGAENTIIVGPNQSSLESPITEMQHILPAPHPSDVLFAVFTSGSTGAPKGTMITHQNFSTIVKYQQGLLGLTANSRVYDFASYAFDIAWCNVLHALTCGGCLCIPSESDRKNNIEGSIISLHANYAHITPTLLRHLDWSKLQSISVLNLSGEAVLPGDVALASPGTKVINAYGPAETNVVTIQDLNTLPANEVSIGRGAGASTWVVDVENIDTLVPIGNIGELWIEGPLVGHGYLDDPERTRAAFVNDPAWLLRGTAKVPGRRGKLYRTGDLVRYRDDGTLAYVGRKDTQVKIRGQRVELGEIETEVHRALGIGHDNASRKPRIVAETIKDQQTSAVVLIVFISLSDASKMTEAAHDEAVQNATRGLEELLCSRLPHYMVPRAYIPIREVPLTSTGKADRRKLQAIGASRPLQELASRAKADQIRRQPTTDNELLMQKLWGKVLGISETSITADDNFFRIGGDSIGAMKLVSAARDHEISLTVTDIFQTPVLHELARMAVSHVSNQPATIKPFSMLVPVVSQLQVRALTASLCNIPENKVLDVYPCTPLQRSLFSRMACGEEHFMTRHAMEIHGHVDLERFRYAWNQVVSRNPIMRTRIVNIPVQGYVQVVLEDAIEWMSDGVIRDCQNHSDKSQMGPGKPLARFAIVRSADHPHAIFLWDMHWSLYDGWALRLMLAEAEKIYYDRAPTPLENMLAFTKYVTESDQKAAMAFWSTQFTHLECAHFPSRKLRKSPSLINNELKFVVRNLDWSRTDFTPATIIRSALSVAIANTLGSNEALFGATVMGRQVAVPGIERMAGPVFSTVPIRVQLSREESFTELLEKVQRQATAMVPFEHTGLEQICQASDDAALACDFQVLLVVQSAIKKGDFRYRDADTELFVKGLVASKDAIVELGQRSGDYPLYVECQLDPSGNVSLRFCFDSRISEEAQVERMANRMEIALRQLSDPARGRDKLKCISQ
ncbi:non-ribosomal peptide synthetase [Penicillium pulvis]|uniref:non-ribosomal peptide synthetase n=1 Tax=Penicillium pulvis TaxID=1562058 RepID=UPI0025474EBC|nr:non-ribosomal peptide synthetase [Penicillium pulvis]KAJ5798287.1 non-ribosomal peptide synthetase [Penicillium pulvis]